LEILLSAGADIKKDKDEGYRLEPGCLEMVTAVTVVQVLLAAVFVRLSNQIGADDFELGNSGRSNPDGTRVVGSWGS